MKTYAIKIGKKHIGLLTTLNNGVAPKVEKKERYLLFTIDEDGTIVASDIVTKRMLLQYDSVGGVLVYHMK